MPSLLPLALELSADIAPTVKKSAGKKPAQKTIKKQSTAIRKKKATANKIRNLRSDESQLVLRELPSDESASDYFISDLPIVYCDVFSAPYRPEQLAVEEVNWLAAQGTPKRGGEKQKRVERRPRSELSKQLEEICPAEPQQPVSHQQ